VESMTAEQAQKLVKEHGSLTKAAKAAGMSRPCFTRWVRKEADAPKKVEERSLSAFAQKYDKDTIVPMRVKEGLKTMPDWLYEMEFSRHSGVTLADLGLYRDMFNEHIVEIKRESRRVWAKTPVIAGKLKEMI
jgi:hypothetical protein